MSITTNELLELLISILVITFLYIYLIFSSKFSLFIFIFMFIIVTLSFAFHELAHKFVAIKNGFIARYKMYEEWILISIFGSILAKLSLFPFVIFATGAVEIFPTERSRYDRTWLIAAAGPITNILLALISLIILILKIPNTEIFILFFQTLGILNSYLAFFNLLPIPPLDGSKIAVQRPEVWIILFVVSIFLMGIFASISI